VSDVCVCDECGDPDGMGNGGRAVKDRKKSKKKQTSTTKTTQKLNAKKRNEILNF